MSGAYSFQTYHCIEEMTIIFIYSFFVEIFHCGLNPTSLNFRKEGCFRGLSGMLCVFRPELNIVFSRAAPPTKKQFSVTETINDLQELYA
jgi:hypothetical protein